MHGLGGHGSTVTIVRHCVTEIVVVPAGLVWEPTAVQLRTVTGETMLGKKILSLTVGGQTVQHLVWLAGVQDPCILGLDFLRATGCHLDLSAGTLAFGGGPEVRMSTRGRLLSKRGCHSTPPLRVGGRVGCDLAPAPVHKLSPVAPTFVPGENADTLPPTSPARPPPSQAGGGPDSMLAAAEEVVRRNSEGLNVEQREQLRYLLMEFKDYFAWGEHDVGLTHLVQHDIETGSARPVKIRPRRIPLARQEAADKAVEEMEKAGFIEPFNSPWSAPVVMAPKKGGKLRFCVDYRGLNAVTEKDYYPLPHIDESLEGILLVLFPGST